jgi:hypothetical protein
MLVTIHIGLSHVLHSKVLVMNLTIGAMKRELRIYGTCGTSSDSITACALVRMYVPNVPAGKGFFLAIDPLQPPTFPFLLKIFIFHTTFYFRKLQTYVHNFYARFWCTNLFRYVYAAKYAKHMLMIHGLFIYLYGKFIHLLYVEEAKLIK